MKLFSSFSLGSMILDHRVVHAPVTRLRSNSDDSVSEMMIDYYRQRTSAGGLLITESAHVSYESRGYLGGPGMYQDSHIYGWKRLVRGVHTRGGRIFMQIAHDGRQSHVDLSNG